MYTAAGVAAGGSAADDHQRFLQLLKKKREKGAKHNVYLKYINSRRYVPKFIVRIMV